MVSLDQYTNILGHPVKNAWETMGILTKPEIKNEPS